MNSNNRPQAFNSNHSNSNVIMNNDVQSGGAKSSFKKEGNKRVPAIEIVKETDGNMIKALEIKIDAQAKMISERFDALEIALIGQVGNASANAEAIIPRLKAIENNFNLMATRENLNTSISELKDSISGKRWDFTKWLIGLIITIILSASAIAVSSYNKSNNSQIFDKLNAIEINQKAVGAK
jgi:hypothetical protein